MIGCLSLFSLAGAEYDYKVNGRSGNVIGGENKAAYSTLPL